MSIEVEAREVDLGDFVRIGIGARALAMGGAHVAVGGDSSSAFWNPAGITEMDCHRFGGMYTDRFSAGIIYQYLSGIGLVELEDNPVGTTSLSLPWETGESARSPELNPLNGKVGFGLTRIGLNTGQLYHSTGNSFGESRTLWLGSGAYRFPKEVISDGVSIGASLKRYGRTVNEGFASGWGYDLGLLYKTELSPTKLPLSGQIGFTLGDPGGVRLQGTTDGNIEPSGVIPQYHRAGMALNYGGRVPALVSVEYDFCPTRPQLNRVGLGAEVSVSEKLSLRAGANRWIKEGKFRITAGAGMETNWLTIDYAYLPHGTLGGTHVISSEFRF